MTCLKAFDMLILYVTYLVPIYIVSRFNGIGVVFGTLYIWLSLWLEGKILSYYDPNREGNILDSIWSLLGWIEGLIYCLLIYFLARGYRCVRKNLSS